MQRAIEVGPNSVLGPMADRTLKGLNVQGASKPEVLSYKTGRSAIYFEDSGVEPLATAKPTKAAEETPKAKASEVKAPPPELVAEKVVQAAPPQVTSGAKVEDVPVSALEVLQVMVALGTGTELSQMNPKEQLGKFAGSGRINDILGELQIEFDGRPNSPSDLTLIDLANQLGNRKGAKSKDKIKTLIGGKTPADFGVDKMRDYLASERMLGDGRAEGVLLVGLTMAPQKRLGSVEEAKKWLDSVVDAYAARQGIQVPRASQMASAQTAKAATMVDSAALQEAQKRQNVLIEDMLRVYHEFLDKDPRAGEKMAEMEASLRQEVEGRLQTVINELGDPFVNGIQPIFNSARRRDYESYWNWARQDVLDIYHGLASGRTQWDSPDLAEKSRLIVNRATEEVLPVIEYHAKKASSEGREALAVYFKTLGNLVRSNLNQPARYLDQNSYLAPQLTITKDGQIQYQEVSREGVSNAEDYVAEMRKGSEYSVDKIPDGEAASQVSIAL
ncbi:MAG TPA: hypothetical protein DF383_09685, partial [Deltaproteobacteria bacterium]|nr:hypothetical protein [Deltaproteobacteria bacterium]